MLLMNKWSVSALKPSLKGTGHMGNEEGTDAPQGQRANLKGTQRHGRAMKREYESKRSRSCVLLISLFKLTLWIRLLGCCYTSGCCDVLESCVYILAFDQTRNLSDQKFSAVTRKHTPRLKALQKPLKTLTIPDRMQTSTLSHTFGSEHREDLSTICWWLCYQAAAQSLRANKQISSLKSFFSILSAKPASRSI